MQEISENISKHGYHNYLVLPGVCPRYSYTIGIFNLLGYELILGGMCVLDPSQMSTIFENFFNLLKPGDQYDGYCINLPYGEFILRPADETWSKFAAFGASHYYGHENIKFMQIFSKDIKNIDDPDMSLSIYDNKSWKYLSEKWPYPVDEGSEVLLDIQAIRGNSISVISRYEQDYWEMFSSSKFEFDGENAKILPLSVVIEQWPQLNTVINMEIDSIIRL